MDEDSRRRGRGAGSRWTSSSSSDIDTIGDIIGTLDVEAGRSRGAVRAEAETDDVSVAERLCATQLGVSYDKRDRS